MKKLIVLLSLCFSFSAYPCSLAPSTEEFSIDKTLADIKAIQPTFEVSKLSRGKKALHSCSGLASLSLKLLNPNNVIQGYRFELVKGTFNKIYFSDVPITVTKYLKEKDTFVFYYNEITNDPIDITVKITAISKSGNESQPQFLNIKDGVKESKPSFWPSWSQQKE